MNRECEWEVEFIPVPIPCKDHEEKIVQLVHALLALLDKSSVQAEDGKSNNAGVSIKREAA